MLAQAGPETGWHCSSSEQRHKETCALTPVGHLRAVSRPCPLRPSARRLWRNATARPGISLTSPANFLSLVCRLLLWDLVETALP